MRVVDGCGERKLRGCIYEKVAKYQGGISMALPEIGQQLEAAVEHFIPVARSIHPDLTEAAVLDKALWLAGEWLRIEREKATEKVAERMSLSGASSVSIPS